MALIATAFHLSAVDVGVAIGAGVSDVGEDELGVALRARDVFVHAAQRITGLVMVEFGDAADRLPCREGMAVLTGDVQIPVRATRIPLQLRLRLSGAGFIQILRRRGRCDQ